MTPRFSARLACFLGLLAAAGCGNSEAGGDETSPSGGAAGSGGASGGAGTGAAPASGGASGDAGTGGTTCPKLEADPRQTIVACGGDPTGTWRLRSMDATGMFMSLRLSTPEGVESTECDTDLAAQTEVFDFLMNFEEGGYLETYVGVFQISLLTSNACFRDGVGASCDDVLVAGQCRSDSCDVCKCDLGNQTPGLGGGEWSTADGTVLVNGSEGYDYCVVGDTLTLLNQSGVRFTLTRFQTTAAPTPCAARTSENCLRGTGCARTGNACVGTAPATCDFTDYFTTPGCEPTPALP